MLTLIRHGPHKDGTFGTLSFKGYLICLTLELLWDNNKVGKSCIPEGSYPVVKRQHWFGEETYGSTYEIFVPGRTAILIHPANIVTELKGCIAPGLKIGRMNGRRAVLDSGDAFHCIKKTLKDMERTNLHVIRLLY
jgi:hypothetical protein